MVAWANLRNYTLVAAVTGAGIGALLIENLHKHPTVVQASRTTNSEDGISSCAIWNNNWDWRDPKSVVKPMCNETLQEHKRYNSELKKKTAKANRHIILIRHGEFYITTHKLSDRGRLQAKYTGQRLHQLGIKFNKVITSTMPRAKETAEIILKEINYDPKHLKHCNYVREGEPIPPQPPEGHVPAEKYFSDEARIEAAYRRNFYRARPCERSDSYTLIVCHSNVIRYFVCRALQFPPEAWTRFCINHASITWLTIESTGRVKLKFLGDSGFIPAATVTNENLKST